MRRTSNLTYRERQVLALVAMGYSREAAGRRLYLSSDTIKSHLKRAAAHYRLPGTATLLVVEAIRRGDIEIVDRGDVRPRPDTAPGIPRPRTSLEENTAVPLRG